MFYDHSFSLCEKTACVVLYFILPNIADEIKSAAWLFSPPPITSMSARSREGRMNSSCIGRTVL